MRALKSILCAEFMNSDHAPLVLCDLACQMFTVTKLHASAVTHVMIHFWKGIPSYQGAHAYVAWSMAPGGILLCFHVCQLDQGKNY